MFLYVSIFFSFSILCLRNTQNPQQKQMQKLFLLKLCPLQQKTKESEVRKKILKCCTIDDYYEVCKLKSKEIEFIEYKLANLKFLGYRLILDYKLFYIPKK